MFSHHQVVFLHHFPLAMHGPRFPFLGFIFGAIVVGLIVYLVYTLVEMLFEKSDSPKPSSAIRPSKSASDSVSSSDSISAVRRW